MTPEEWERIKGKRIVSCNQTEGSMTFLLEDGTEMEFRLGYTGGYEGDHYLNFEVRGEQSWQFK